MLSKRPAIPHFSTLFRVCLALVPGAASWHLYPGWVTVVLTLLLALLSSRAVLYAQTLLAAAWILLNTVHALSFPASLEGQEVLYRFLQGGLLVLLYARGKPLVISFSDDNRLAKRISAGLTSLAVCLGIACLFRSTSLLYIGWAAVLILYAHPIQSIPLLKSVKLLLSFCIPLVIMAVILEIGTRQLLPIEQKPGGLYLPDPDAIYTLRPGGETGYSFKDNSGNILEWHAVISPQGIRDQEYGAKTYDEYRIVTLGDSYTMGQTLPWADTFQRKLECLLNQENPSRRFTVVNCGVPGYAPWQERIFLQKRGFSFEPDLVLLQLFPPNDIAGSYTKIGKFLHAFIMEWEQRILNFRRQHECPFFLERWFQQHSNGYRLWCSLTGRSGYVRDAALNFRLIPQFAYDAPPLISARNPYQEACLVDWYPELYEAWTLYEEGVRGIHDDCRERGIPLAAFVHGEYISLDPEFWERLNREFPDHRYERNKDIRLTTELLTALDIPNTDVIEAFSAYPEPEDLYYLHEGHFSPDGAAVLASCLRDFLLKTVLNRD